MTMTDEELQQYDAELRLETERKEARAERIKRLTDKANSHTNLAEAAIESKYASKASAHAAIAQVYLQMAFFERGQG